MIDMARMFASHGAKSTIISTPKHALPFRESIVRDQRSGRLISIEILCSPDEADISDTNMSATPMTDTSMLEVPLKKLLLQRKPDCIVHDISHHWAADAIGNLELDVPRIVFNGNGCFASCVRENLSRFKPHETDGSKYEPFVMPGLDDWIVLTRSQLPGFQFLEDNILKSMEICYGVVVNSFYELEPAYVEPFKKRNKAWIVGPVSLYNRNIADKADRGKKAAIDEQSILSWLDSIPPNSGLIINGWAPQLLILEHGSVGGFMTHCGWNSTLEGVSCCVPMITWPISAEQFYNEKLVTDVLKIGVRVGSLDWRRWTMEPRASVGRDMVETAVNRLMDGGGEGAEMRNKARVIGEIAKKAVEEGGSSYEVAIALIKELEDRLIAACCTREVSGHRRRRTIGDGEAGLTGTRSLGSECSDMGGKTKNWEFPCMFVDLRREKEIKQLTGNRVKRTASGLRMLRTSFKCMRAGGFLFSIKTSVFFGDEKKVAMPSRRATRDCMCHARPNTLGIRGHPTELCESLRGHPTKLCEGSRASYARASERASKGRSPGVHGDLQGHPEGMVTYVLGRACAMEHVHSLCLSKGRSPEVHGDLQDRPEGMATYDQLWISPYLSN
ncbi:putative UDP-glycosyltransferase 73B4 [Hibiscus syriacus]|uniref:UDP-glycosyltransferase 73B4 n=1 Tax=Hibiscus syriacus TaxID=106335 RepID=A0A6A2X597_HIBSY|nr:putative UDP-glycosyltransferase 73B4 [Hibiscus syriacus]